MIRAKTRFQAAHRTQVAPFLALAGLNIAAACTAAVALPLSDELPGAIAMHGALMIVAWGCLLPLGGLVARYFKVTPNQAFLAVVDNPFWWNVHRIAQYAGVSLATVAAVMMLRLTGGHVGTVHGRCGLVLMALAWMQLASPLFRGSKGGPTRDSRPGEDRALWRGDHYDMTLRRRLFESWHKPVGWALLAGSQGVILLGIDLAGSPPWLLGLFAAMTGSIGLAILDSSLRGRWISTHAALWGPEHEIRMKPRP